MHIKTRQVKMLIHASLAPRSVDFLENRKATGKSNAEMMLHLVVTIWCTESPYDIQFYWFSVMDSPSCPSYSISDPFICLDTVEKLSFVDFIFYSFPPC